MSTYERFTLTRRVLRGATPLAIVALGLGFAAGCGLPRVDASRGVAFGTASGAESSGRPFTVLRFTPSGPGATVNGTAVARHPSGDVVIAGTFVETADVGVGPGSLGGSAAFVGRYSPSGAARWVRWVRTQTVSQHVAINGEGEIFLVGETQYAPRPFGVPDPTSCGDLPICKPGPAIHAFADNGDLRWSRALPASEPAERMWPELVAAGAGGDVTIAGRFGRSHDMFVARYSRETGERRWFTRGRTATATSLGLTSDGDAIVGGFTAGTVRFDDVSITAQGWESGFLARLDAKDGVGRWVKAMNINQTPAVPIAIAHDFQGQIVVVNQRRSVPDASTVEVVDTRDGATKRTAPLSARERRGGELMSAAIDRAPDGSPLVALTYAADPTNATTVMGFTTKLAPTFQRTLRASPGAKPASQVDAASIAAVGPTEALVIGSFTGRVELGGNLAEAPWAHEKRRCPTFDDDDDDCTHDWAARAMFVARIKR